MNRTRLGRYGGGIEEEAGDPLDGLVNLFDIGIVLAVAFLVAGLGLSVDPTTGRIGARTPTTKTRSTPARTTPRVQPGVAVSGRGDALGTLYRLADGRLVVVEADGSQRPVAP